MILPRKVEEVLIAVGARHYDEVVRRLAEAGLMHVDKPPEELGRVDRRFQTEHTRAREKLSRLEAYFQLVGAEPETLRSVELRIPGWLEGLSHLEREYADLEEAFQRGEAEIARLEERLASLQQAKAILEVFKHIEEDLVRASNASFIGFALGVTSKEGLDLILGEARERLLLVAWEEAGEEAYAVAVVGRQADVRAVVAKVRAAGWTPYTVPEGLPGVPAKAYKQLEEEITRIASELESIRESLRRQWLGSLREYYTKLVVLSAALELLANTAARGDFRFIRGYVDVRDSRRLRRLVEEATEGAYAIYSLGVRRARTEEERVPTRIELPRLIKPFHKLIEMYGEPEPNEVVPTLFAAFTMPVFFGLMFPDLGHALLVIIFAYYLFKDRDPEWAYVLSVLGLAGAITGFLAGEFFGPLTGKPIVEFWHHLGFSHPPLSSPVDVVAVEKESAEAAIAFMYRWISISLFLAGYTLSLGTLLGFVNALLEGKKAEAFAVKLGKFVLFLTGTLPFLMHPLDVSAAAGLLNRAIFGPRTGLAEVLAYIGAAAFLWVIIGPAIVAAVEGEGIGRGFAEGFLEFYESFLMILGNTASFLRILGLSLAHASLMVGFYEMTIPFLHGLAYLAGATIYILGNLLTAGLEAIIVFAHSLRLHYYEWFSKFYRGTGIPFKPVKLPEGARIILAGAQA